jgi:hypothetical protein
MKENLIISSEFYHKIDYKFYKKNNFDFLDINIFFSNSFEFDIFKYQNIICLLDNIQFDSILKTRDIFNNRLNGSYNFYNENNNLIFENFNIFCKKFPKYTKFIIYDNDTEHSAKYTKQILTNEWFEINSNFYFITSRIFSFSHKNMISELIYLPIIFSFYLLKFYKYPMLDTPISTNQKYDFLTYLGHTPKLDNIEFRLNFLNKIFNNDISKIKYKHLDLVDDDVMGIGKEGHFWNLLNSLSAKVQIIFETSAPVHSWVVDDTLFLTEKTMKCFLLSHPYILLLPSRPLIMLENYGFKFPIKCNSISEFEKEINYLKNNIDEWINQNRHIFENNQINFYKMIESTQLPHHHFLEKILNN